jgi:hypothetical protein
MRGVKRVPHAFKETIQEKQTWNYFEVLNGLLKGLKQTVTAIVQGQMPKRFNFKKIKRPNSFAISL